MNKLIVLIGVLVWSTFLFSGCMTSGDNAVDKMNEEERILQKKLVDSINEKTTYNDVELLLGTPDRGAGSVRPSWKPIPDDDLNQIAIYFKKNSADQRVVRKIKWMKVGVFMWEHSFENIPSIEAE